MGNKFLISIEKSSNHFLKDTFYSRYIAENYFFPALWHWGIEILGVGNLDLKCCNMKLLLYKIYIMVPN